MNRSIRVILGWTLVALMACGCSSGKGAGGDAGKAAGATGNASSDALITKAVQDKIDADPSLKSEGITVKVTGAQVELDGSVKTIADKDKMEAAVSDAIKGFSSVNAGVVDNIMISESGSASGSH